MNVMVNDPVKKISQLTLLQGLLVFVPIAFMKFMPESDWFWLAIEAALVLSLIGELIIVFRAYKGWTIVLAAGATLSFLVVGLPIIGFFGFLTSLAIGTFVFPPM